MARPPTRDDFTFLIGKALTEVSFGEGRTQLRFDEGARIDFDGDAEHRVHGDALGRAAPDTRAMPSLLHLVGMKVRQVGLEREYLLLTFEDGHEVRLFAGSDKPRFELVSR